MALSFVVGFRHHLTTGRACGLHAHRDLELVYHPTGSGHTSGGGEQLPFAPGDLVVYPARAAHDQVMEVAGDDWCIHVRGGELPTELTGVLWSAAVGHDAVTVAELEWLTSGLAASDSPLANQRLAAVLTTALSCRRTTRSGGAADPAQELAERAQRLAALRGHAIPGVEELARELGASPDWLRHACARAGLEAPLRMLTRARLARARTLLEHTSQPLSAVAEQSGYREARYLVAVFRRELGCTPGQLRAGRAATRPRRR